MTQGQDYDPGDLNPGAHRPRVAAAIYLVFAIMGLVWGAHIVLYADLQAHWQSMLETRPFVMDPDFPQDGSWQYFVRSRGLFMTTQFICLFFIMAHFALLPRPKPSRQRGIVFSASALGLLALGALSAFLFAPADWTDQSIDMLLTDHQAYLWIYAAGILGFGVMLIWTLTKGKDAIA